MKLSIVIVNWNSAAYLSQCIESIYKWEKLTEYEIIVVDCASTDSDTNAVLGQLRSATVISLSENIGFAAGNNVGFKASSGDFVLFLNPDTLLICPIFQKLLHQATELSACGIIGCRLLNQDRTVQTSSIQTFPTILNHLLDVEALRLRWPDCSLWRIGPLFSQDSQPVRVDVVSGACMLVRREVFRSVDMFSEDYFMYAEDLDLCHKVIAAGFHNWFVGDATIVHYGGQSSPTAWAAPAKWRAIIRYLVKHKGKVYAFVFRVIMLGAAVFRLSILLPADVVGRLREEKPSPYSSAQKWLAILKTLLLETGTSTGKPPVPPNGTPKVTVATLDSESHPGGRR